jgi:aminocarboxymuconate-semialdehyde decarboxylase
LAVIDTHAHWTPDRYRAAVEADGEWYGLDSTVGELENAGFRMTLEERVADMDALGVDVQLVSPTAGFYQYANDLETTAAIARECNDEIADVLARCPERFLGLGTLPMQDVDAAVAELERVMTSLRLKGVMISDHVNDRLYDEPEFVRFWETAERLGALIFFHQGPDRRYKVGRYHLDNSIGNLVDRALVFAILSAGGVLDRFPNLKLLLAHAGGYAAFGAARMDKAAGFFVEDQPPSGGQAGYTVPYAPTPEYDAPSSQPPSAYLGKFFYDCCTFTGATLRFLIDTVGIDQVVLGTDAPAPMVLTDAVRWLASLDCLTDDERHAIVTGNPSRMLGV